MGVGGYGVPGGTEDHLRYLTGEVMGAAARVGHLVVPEVEPLDITAKYYVIEVNIITGGNM